LTIAYEYNSDGHCTAQPVDGVTTTYILAVLGLPQVLAETSDGETTRYLYGYGLLGEEGSVWAWHLGDGLNSVRQLADGSGQVTLAQGYTPFGVPLWSEGDATSAYGFTGEQWYYEPTTGRFVTPDSIILQPANPQSLNMYIFVLGNPLRYTGPSGYEVTPTQQAWWHWAPR
jgi:hypothetical protein